MKILYIITQADGGGAQNYCLALAKHFKGAIAAGEEAGQLFANAQAAGLKTFRLKHLKRDISPWHDLLAVFEIARLIKQERPDIVHLNSTKAGFLGSLAFALHRSRLRRLVQSRDKSHGPKIIFTAHGFRFLEPLSPAGQWFYLMAEKIASWFRDYIICVSDTDKKSALNNNIISANKIITIHNGLPPLSFINRDGGRRALRLPSDKFIFGTVANFYKTKGLDVLISAVGMISKTTLLNSLFVIVGDGSEIENLKLKIKNLRLENTIKLLGNIINAKNYLKAFDCFILPSRKEGFPYSLLEAMQAGLPIISTNVGGIPEAAANAGILVEPNNPKKMAMAITEMFQNTQLRETLSAKALAQAKLFTEKKMLEETEAVYNQI